MSSHKASTLDRIRQENVILILQDATEIDFSGRKTIDGMGYLNKDKSQGFYLHPSIAVTPSGLCLGLVGLQHWIREKLGIREERKQKSIEEKRELLLAKRI